MSDAKSTGREAADRGTRLHGVLESFYEGKLIEFPNYVYRVNSALESHFGPANWEAERSFSWGGYGGKVDLIAENIVVDFKSKEGDLSKITPYHEQIMQLSAYRMGLNKPTARCANIYFTEAGDVRLIEHSEQDLSDAWECFQYLLAFYKKKNSI
jgi:hypothetical protein